MDKYLKRLAQAILDAKPPTECHERMSQWEKDARHVAGTLCHAPTKTYSIARFLEACGVGCQPCEEQPGSCPMHDPQPSDDYASHEGQSLRGMF